MGAVPKTHGPFGVVRYEFKLPLTVILFSHLSTMASPERLSFEELLANLSLGNSPPSPAPQPRHESPLLTTLRSNSAAPSYQLQVSVTMTVEWGGPTSPR